MADEDRTATHANAVLRKPGETLSTVVPLSVGQLFYRDTHRKPHYCVFQFNPTELERTRNIAYTRSRTGNTLEEPRVGGRNAAKRKQTRKLEPWTMSVTLRFDAAYGMDSWTLPSPLPTFINDPSPPPPFNSATANYIDQIDRIDRTMRFFEQIVEAEPFVSENENIANADETPPPPYVVLAFGPRSWQCALKSVRIKEEDYTPDLYLRRFEATLSLEVIEIAPPNETGKATRP
jgi:hypothetical protein